MFKKISAFILAMATCITMFAFSGCRVLGLAAIFAAWSSLSHEEVTQNNFNIRYPQDATLIEEYRYCDRDGFHGDGADYTVYTATGGQLLVDAVGQNVFVDASALQAYFENCYFMGQVPQEYKPDFTVPFMWGACYDPEGYQDDRLVVIWYAEIGRLIIFEMYT